MHKITIDDKVILASDGTVLSEALMKGAAMIEHPCGGRGKCRKCRVLVNGKEELSCQYIIRSDIEVMPCHGDEMYSQTVDVEIGEISKNVCFALDVGTTTLALALFNIGTGEINKTLTAINPQRIYGADVMTRISYCQKNSSAELTVPLINELNRMLSQFSYPEGTKMYVAGNTTMLHLLFGCDPSSMGMYPYTPSFLEGRRRKGNALCLNGISEVVSLPGISAFVGADIVAGINYVEMPEKGRFSLLVDLGTNAEIALFSEEKILCTAAAAGPCFEGTGIACGMSAVKGAVCTFSLDERGTVQTRTVADGEIEGICATGLIDMIASLLSKGIIDGSGYMERERFNITDKVYLERNDIRQFQLAKSAILSAVISLVNMAGISFNVIEKVYISGGFSLKMNIDNAVKVGLLPREVKDKCVAINNSSLLGTVRYAFEKNDLSSILKNAVYEDLSSNPVFAELFISNMVFEE